jgi:molybdopterin/thiamine biosynthesis adenylyltransferase
MTINEEELEIFSRQLILSEFSYKKFNKLQNKVVSIIGIGGIGCPLAQYLIACGIKNLNIFDHDVVSKNNLNRQTLYALDDIGKKKVNVAKKKLVKINPNTNINNFDMKINNLSLKYLKKSSIIIDASDNWNTMRLINEYSVKYNIPLISASAIGFDIQIILFENKKNKHLCLECIFPNKEDPDLPRCDTVGILGTVTGLAGLICAQKTINYLMNFNNDNSLLTLIDCKKIAFNNILIKTNTKCNLN